MFKSSSHRLVGMADGIGWADYARRILAEDVANLQGNDGIDKTSMTCAESKVYNRCAAPL
jgi:hypothetical protein